MTPLMFSSQAKIGNFKKRKRPLSPGQALSCRLTESSQMQAQILLCQFTHLLRYSGGHLAGGTVTQNRCGLRREARREAQKPKVFYSSLGNFWICSLALIGGKWSDS